MATITPQPDEQHRTTRTFSKFHHDVMLRTDLSAGARLCYAVLALERRVLAVAGDAGPRHGVWCSNGAAAA